MFYASNPGEAFFPRAALSAIAGREVRLAHDERGFRVVLPDGSDPAEGEPDAWASYSNDPQPDAATIAAWGPPVPEPEPEEPLTDVEILFLQRVQPKLNADEEKRTGKTVNPNGAVPLSRAIAATAIIYNGWNYPSPKDLETEFNQFLLSRIYADPTTNTNEQSSTEQKQSVLHFTLVMLAGQAFGVDYQAELGAYERTASQDFQLKLKDDDRDWLKLPCPKMHKDWPEFETIKAMFQAVMK